MASLLIECMALEAVAALKHIADIIFWVVLLWGFKSKYQLFCQKQDIA